MVSMGGMIRWLKTLAACLVLLSLAFPCIAQERFENQTAMGKSIGELEAWLRSSPQQMAQNFELIKSKQAIHSGIEAPPNLSSPEWSVLRQHEQAFFCRIEHQLSLKIQIPFKFRLGSVQYVDWLEGKPGCGAFGY